MTAHYPFKFHLRRSFAGLRPLLLACLVTTAAAPLHAEPPPWPESPFSYLGKEQELDRILAGFAKTFGLELRLETGLPSGATVSGRSSAASPAEFLNQLSSAYGLSWYYHAGVLYVSRSSERSTRLVPTKGLSGAALKKAFAEMGILEAKFGWSELDDRSAVMVSGPRTYVERIEKSMSAFPEPVAEQQILVFRLKHASVDDRMIQYRDKQIVTPGVATMLRNLLADADGGGGGSAMLPVAQGIPLPLAAPMGGALRPLASEPASANAAPAAAPAGPAPAARGGRGHEGNRGPKVVIQSDPRLNAIIIKDKPQNAAIYKELIDLLDVPSSLVEIEAAIVDINTSSMSELGVSWNGRIGNIAGGFGVPSKAPDDTTFTLVRGNNVNPATVIADAGNFLMSRIKLLEGKGNARIVSRPFILTQDNMGALIDLSDTFYVQTSGERVATVTPISVGVTLRVTPRIVLTGNTRSVQLVVDIEDGSIQDTKVGTLPTVRRSVIGTQALIAENESLLIGGFNSEQNLRQKDGVPVLGDIPGVGVLFSKTVGSTQKQERMFLITPKIIPDRLAQVAALAGQVVQPVAQPVVQAAVQPAVQPTAQAATQPVPRKPAMRPEALTPAQLTVRSEREPNLP
ncbi:MAG: type III secretion system outer membrane ring subunit SctC [Polaromonas sp.]|nr:type III secretion system outer membrane ring subunit SctC [Polaromonas sp.]